MSGGHFEYSQYRITDIYDTIESEIKQNNKVIPNNERDSWVKPGSKYSEWSDKTIKEFKKGVELLKKAQVYAQRIDWLLSGNDGEESFHERLKEELNNLKITKNENRI